MGNKFELSDSEFESKFINCELNSSDFNHEAHLRLAWININKYGIHQAELNIQNQIWKFAQFVGEIDMYNTTLTIAATKTVHHFILKSKTDNFKEFIGEFPQLKNNFKALMDCHYSFDIYNSDKAKKQFLPPDLIPFD